MNRADTLKKLELKIKLESSLQKIHHWTSPEPVHWTGPGPVHWTGPGLDLSTGPVQDLSRGSDSAFLEFCKKT